MFKFLSKMREKKEREMEDTFSKFNDPFKEIKVSTLLEDNMDMCKKSFSDMDVIKFREIKSQKEDSFKAFIVFCGGMVNTDTIGTNIIKPLISCNFAKDNIDIDAILKGTLQVVDFSTTDSFDKIVESVMSGDTVLFIEGCFKAAVLYTKEYSLRAVEEPENEKVIGGPREGFNESLAQNLTQVIRRARTNELKTKILTIGRRTKTEVCVCYFDSLVDKDILKDLLIRLNSIEIDAILDANYITELIGDHRYSHFRTTGYSERPDAIVAKLLEGRIAIFIDGSPMVLTIPYLFIENFQSSEDYYFNFYYSTFARLLRIAAFFLTIMVPAIYIATEAFHQEMLPLQLLIRMAQERQSVPLPAAIETVIMLIVFDVLRETGVRMPSNIGQTLGIVGALVIGDAAVQASLIAAPMIIVVGVTGITSLLVPRLNSPIIFWRFFLLFLSATFGFFGFTIGTSLLFIHISNLTSFGVEQICLDANFSLRNIKDIFVRAPINLMVNRPDSLTSNATRQLEENVNE
ncbi:MAG: spore germination protein [Eubacteriales bacterium]|jgi:spore germination protein KA|nr:spore germination protein [Eubacteriales bacterium]